MSAKPENYFMTEYQKLLKKSVEGTLTKKEIPRYLRLGREVQEKDARQKLATATERLRDLLTKRVGIEKEIDEQMGFVVYAGAVLAPKPEPKKKGAKR